MYEQFTFTPLSSASENRIKSPLEVRRARACTVPCVWCEESNEHDGKDLGSNSVSAAY